MISYTQGGRQNDFNPRSPCGERPVRTGCRWQYLHFNPRSPCGERHQPLDVRMSSSIISIHAPRAGSDAIAPISAQVRPKFQSTLPVRGATRVCIAAHSDKAFQSTLPVRGATFRAEYPLMRCVVISIHAPRAGSDQSLRCIQAFKPDFNPRSPCGERRSILRPQHVPALDFNPRSPCGERRCRSSAVRSRRRYFNPRSPCGERRRESTLSR